MRGGGRSAPQRESDPPTLVADGPGLSRPHEHAAAPAEREATWEEGGPIRVGDVIGDRYRVDKLLGAGGMGQVVEALHLELERVVAVKILHQEWANDDDSARRFVREARVIATLSNEHVVRIFDLGRTPTGAPYIVMERLEGSDLGGILQKGTPIAVADAVEWTAQAAEALSEAHDHGIVHRDVKPQNIFLTEVPGRAKPIVKVLDFGLAKNLVREVGEESALTGVHMLLGSPHFMSPEQIRDARGVDLRADIWSLGATLYQLLTHSPPFDAKNLHMLCAGILTAPIPSVREKRPEVASALDAIVRRCLDRDLGRRYPNARELAVDLRACLAAGPTEEQAPISETERARPVVPGLATAATIATPHGFAPEPHGSWVPPPPITRGDGSSPNFVTTGAAVVKPASLRERGVVLPLAGAAVFACLGIGLLVWHQRTPPPQGRIDLPASSIESAPQETAPPPVVTPPVVTPPVVTPPVVTPPVVTPPVVTPPPVETRVPPPASEARPPATDPRPPHPHSSPTPPVRPPPHNVPVPPPRPPKPTTNPTVDPYAVP